MTQFVSFIPLSNWLRGFDRYRMTYSKVLIPESTHPDAFYLLREDEPWSPGLAKARRLVSRLGRPGDRVVQLRADLPEGPTGARPNTVTGTGVGWRWPSPEIPLRGVAWVDDRDNAVPAPHEDVTAAAFRLGDAGLRAWSDCRPRTLSVLPVARACNARCAFCFSKASVSDLARQPSARMDAVLGWADTARARGAERAVITGGGEPTLLAADTLTALTRGLAARFPTVVLITNASGLDAARLDALVDAGLGVLAVSRHGLDPHHDAQILGLHTSPGPLVATCRRRGVRARSICVLQRGGVDTEAKVLQYVERCATDGFHEVCFKELYVSSLDENPWATGSVNAYCAQHQVPLSVVIAALQGAGFELTAKLPWGSPVYEGRLRGQRIRVAAYTEPSVGWERTHGLVRSWNVMADGSCVASLEDPSSELAFPTARVHA